MPIHFHAPALRGCTPLVLAAGLFLSACGGNPAPSGPAPRATYAHTIRLGPPSSAAERAAPVEAADAVVAPGASLAIPVRGIRPEQLRDSYHDPRGGGRLHRAIDIMAPRGTPVMAASDGTIMKLRTGGLGGITIYQVGPDGRTLYYYAHLERYAAGLREGLPVARGQVIAYVGDTGNAGRGNYHLHFSVGRLTDPRRWWDSENTNPYPLLAGDAAYRAGPVLGGGQR